MSNLLRKIAIGGAIVGFAAISLPAFGVVSDACKADLSQCTTEELTEYIAELSATLQALQNQLGALQGQGTTPTTPTASNYTGIPAGFTFTKNLYQGMRDQDVVYLKKVLDVEVPDHAPWTGSSYFGPKTKAAVIAFQTKYKTEISNYAGYTIHCTGFVGKGTRAQLNALLSATPPTPPAAACSSDADCDTGYKCQDGSCVKKSADEITAENECTAVGYYWYNDACHEEAQPAQAGLTVALADDTPAAGVILTGQGKAPLAKYIFTNEDADEVKVTEIKLTRLGVSSDTTVDPVYLYKGNTRLAKTGFTSRIATFSDPDGLFTIGSGETVTITVSADVASGTTAGQTIGVSIASVNAITSNASAVNATFPLKGNLMSIASGSGLLASVEFETSTLADTEVQPGNTGVEVWKGKITPSTNDVLLKYIKFRQKGNIVPDDLQNFKLYIEGSQVGSAAKMASDYSVAFDLSDSPVTLKTGERVVKLTADIIGGAGRTAQFYLSEEDLLVEDSEYGVLIDTGTSQYTCEELSISGGSITVKVASDSPAAVPTTTDTVIAKFTLKAYGEKIKVDKLTASSSEDISGVIFYKEGSALNSSSTVETSNDTDIDITDFYIQPGESVTLTVKADMTGASTGTHSFTLKKVTGSSDIQGSGHDFFSGTKTAYFDVLAVTFDVDFAKSPDAFLASTGESPVIAQYKFTSQGSDITLKKVYLEASTTDAWQVVTAYKLKIGDNPPYTADEDESTDATSTFIVNEVVKGGTTVKADVIAELRSVSSATDGKNIATKITKYVYERDGVDYTVTEEVGPSNEVYVYRSVPEVEVLSTGQNTNVTQGANTNVTLYSWKVTAKGNDLKVATTTLYVSKAGSSATTTLENIELLLNGSLVDSSKYTIASSSDLGDTSVTTSTLTITPQSGYEDLFEINAGESLTFTVRADVTFEKSGGFVKTYLLGDNSATTTGANFVWNDKVTATEKDVSGYLVKGLPAAGTEAYLVKYYSQ